MTTETQSESAMPVEKMAYEHDEHATRDPTELHVTNADEQDPKITWLQIVVVLSILLAYIVDTLLILGVGAILLPINQDIGPSAQYTWMANGQTMGSAALAPFVGRLSDIFGRRWFFLIGCLLSAIGCIVQATAQSVNTVICGSVFVGCAIACHSLAWTALPEIFPSKFRPYVLSIINTGLALVGAFGPLIGYGFIERGSWRGLFYLCFGIECAAAALLFIFYHPNDGNSSEETKLEQIKSLDFLGAILGTSGLVLFLLGISFGGVTAPWKSVTTLAPLILGFVLIVACGLWEAYADLNPMFPKRMWKNIRGFTVVVGGMFIIGMVIYSTAILWAQQITRLYTTDPIIVGAWSGTFGFAAVISLIGAIPFRRFKGTNIMLTASVLILATSTGCQAIVSPKSQVASTILVFVTNFMSATTIVGSFTIIQLSVVPDDLGIASQTANAMRSLGGSVATAIYSTVLTNEITKNLPKYIVPVLVGGGVALQDLPVIIGALAVGDMTSPAVTALAPATLNAALEQQKYAWAASFRMVYLIGIAFGALGTICVAFSADVFHLMGNKVNVQLKEVTFAHKTDEKEKTKHEA